MPWLPQLPGSQPFTSYSVESVLERLLPGLRLPPRGETKTGPFVLPSPVTVKPESLLPPPKETPVNLPWAPGAYGTEAPRQSYQDILNELVKNISEYQKAHPVKVPFPAGTKTLAKQQLEEQKRQFEKEYALKQKQLALAARSSSGGGGSLNSSDVKALNYAKVFDAWVKTPLDNLWKEKGGGPTAEEAAQRVYEIEMDLRNNKKALLYANKFTDKDIDNLINSALQIANLTPKMYENWKRTGQASEPQDLSELYMQEALKSLGSSGTMPFGSLK